MLAHILRRAVEVASGSAATVLRPTATALLTRGKHMQSGDLPPATWWMCAIGAHDAASACMLQGKIRQAHRGCKRRQQLPTPGGRHPSPQLHSCQAQQLHPRAAPRLRKRKSQHQADQQRRQQRQTPPRHPLPPRLQHPPSRSRTAMLRAQGRSHTWAAVQPPQACMASFTCSTPPAT